MIVVGPLSPSKRYDVEAVDVVVQEAKESQLNELEQKHKVVAVFVVVHLFSFCCLLVLLLSFTKLGST